MDAPLRDERHKVVAMGAIVVVAHATLVTINHIRSVLPDVLSDVLSDCVVSIYQGHTNASTQNPQYRTTGSIVTYTNAQ